MQPPREDLLCTERRIQGPPTFISIIHGGGVVLCHRQGFTKVFLILDTTVHILNKLLEIYLKTHRGKCGLSTHSLRRERNRTR